MSERLSDYEYMLPDELIAQRPLARRDESRMMVLHRSEQRIEHRKFAELGQFLFPHDLLVLNNTRVLSARRFSDDGKIEFLFLEQLGPASWKCLVKPGRKMRVAGVTKINGAKARVEEICAGGERVISFESEENFFEGGLVPLPPYIGRQSDPSDVERYQTVFAEVPGAIAAPTAGLHFTPEILEQCRSRGAEIVYVTLHVGLGTFQPVRSDTLHEEHFAISEEAAAKIEAASRVICVGTTSVRAVESMLLGKKQETDLFIRPGFHFLRTDAMLTNFHLPQSSLLMLVCAFAGRELVLAAYRYAVEAGYRFYSYGDCMLVV